MEWAASPPVGSARREVLRILSVRSKLDGVGHYRVSIPALALRDRGHTVDILDNQEKIRVYNNWFADYDVVILQNLSDPGWFEVINTIPEGRRPVTVGCIDDLFGGLPKDNPSYPDYEKARKSMVECVKLCDGMVYSTPEIAAHYAGLNPRYRIVPNYLDIPGYRDWDTPEERQFPDRLVIGWLGGIHHVNDELPMAEGLRKFLIENPKAIFAFCGNRDLSVLWKRSIGIRDYQFAYMPGAEFDGYQSRISQFDIGVAPLRDTEFNRCKSDLRLLEYGAWGVPYVASDVAPYRRFAEQSGFVGGDLAANPKDWHWQLMSLAYEANRREKYGRLIKQYVREHRGHYACGEAWETALSSILTGDTFDCDAYQKVGRTSRCPCGSGRKYKRCCFPAWGE